MAVTWSCDNRVHCEGLGFSERKAIECPFCQIEALQLRVQELTNELPSQNPAPEVKIPDAGPKLDDIAKVSPKAPPVQVGDVHFYEEVKELPDLPAKEYEKAAFNPYSRRKPGPKPKGGK